MATLLLRRIRAAGLPLLCLLSLSLFGQTAPKPPAAAQLSSSANDEVVELSPFVIGAERGWVGSASLIGNRTNKQIADLPLSIDAITADFMQDLGAYTLEDAAEFVSNMTTVGLLDGVSPRSRDEGRVAYRGLESSSATAGGSTAQSARNFFVWYSPTDNYNIERIDFNKGSNSLMFGDASPGGQAATYTKRAQFRSSGQVTAMYGSFDSYRLMLDVNRKLNDKLAMRFNYVARSEGTYLKDVASKLRAAHVAVTYQPFKNTQIRVEGERGKYDRTRGTNTIFVQQNSAPGGGYNTANRWYVTSDDTIINRTPSFTALYPNPTARDAAGPSGLALSSLEDQTLLVNLRTTSGPTSGTATATGQTVAFPGRSKSTSLFPDDRLERPFSNASIWVLQNVGKLALEVAYNQQQTRQVRNDGTPSNVMIDGSGRPYVQRTYSVKDYTSRVSILRGTASYPFDFGKLGTQYLVLTASTQEDRSFRWRYLLANFAPVDSGLAGVNVRNHQIIGRAYLDDPEFGTDAFWAQSRPENLPVTPGFRAAWFQDTSAVNPFIETAFSKAYSASSAGTYLGGRLHSILGVRYDIFDRKLITTLPQDSIGQSIFVGLPDEAPQAYSFDPNSDLTNTTYSAGFSYQVLRGVNVYANYSTSYRWQSAELFTGENPGPVLGDTREIGIKAGLFDNRLFVTLAAYRIARENSVYVWSGGPTPENMEDLFNPNDLLPGDPSYFKLPDGRNNEARTTLASENSKGIEATFQFKRIAGVQARITGSYNEVTAARDFSAFRAKLEAAETRTSAALKPGGNAALAEEASDLALARQVLAANDGIVAITGNRSTPWSANWLLDYEFSNKGRLKGTRLAVYGNWRDNYNLALLGGITYRGGASHPVSAYALHRRQIRDKPVSFRLGIKDIIDLQSPNKDYRRANVIGLNPDGTTINQYRYLNPISVNFTVTVDF